jgi:glycosyltransferase involved in cell wall biosynthesis
MHENQQNPTSRGLASAHTGHAGRAYWDAEVFSTIAAARTAAGQRSAADDSIDITFYVSCYNEAQYIGHTLTSLCSASREAGLSFEAIVIDDGSKDDSCDIVRRFIADHPDENITLRINRKNKGLAQNYIDCAFLGRGHYYRLTCGDNPEPHETMVTILKAVGSADCIVPYHVFTEERSFLRRTVSSAYSRIINKITGNDIRYYNGLAVHVRENVMRWHTNTRGFGFQAEILCLLLDLGFTYRQVQVLVSENREGKSNALNIPNFLSVAHTVAEIATRRISNAVYKRPYAKRAGVILPAESPISQSE